MTITKLVAVQDTWIKATTQQASDLQENQKVFKPRNSVIALKHSQEVPETSHLKVELADDPNKNWYIFNSHWDVVEAEGVELKPLKKPTSVVIDWNDFSNNVSEFFTVGELLNYDRRRIPKSEAAKKKLIALAAELDKIRKEWGGPIRVTSAYRPEPINQQVGGVRNSRHVEGDAADIAPMKGNLIDFQKWVDTNWFGALGYGARRGFVHIDMRNGNGWKRGRTKGVRWNY